jgi:hypothetical protein
MNNAILPARIIRQNARSARSHVNEYLPQTSLPLPAGSAMEVEAQPTSAELASISHIRLRLRRNPVCGEFIRMNITSEHIPCIGFSPDDKFP